MSDERDFLRVGVDIGGTFTDLVGLTDGSIDVVKTPSTPDAFEEGVERSVETLVEETAYSCSDVSFFGHGATLTTNAVLEKEWADAALITTEGFRDVLEIRRQNRPALYDLQAEKPAPFIERDKRFGIAERIDEHGAILTEVDEAAVEELGKALANADVESVAISLLFAYENPSHETRIKELLTAAGLDDIPFSLSSDVLPEVREYERTQTTALNAVLQPIMAEYLTSLAESMEALGIPAALRIMQSNGGMISAEVAQHHPVKTCLSGPAAGVQGAAHVADRCDISNIITMDMGGTSCDVSLVEEGDPVISTEGTVGDYSVSVPMIDIHTIGSGGGSIAWVDKGGALRVGPESAGADPGPICYGRGGDRPTITDAHMLLGRIDPTQFSAEFESNKAEIHTVVEDTLARRLGMSVEETAQGILDIANANMKRALRVVSVERGYDPRNFTLVAYGGAGPLHGCKLAAELDIPTVIIPTSAGVLSALGLVVTDLLYDYSTSHIREWEALETTTVAAQFEKFIEQGRDQLRSAGVADEEMGFQRVLDVRYKGQSYEIRVPVPDGDIDAALLDRVRDRFHARHERQYGHASPEEAIELVTVRLRARGEIEPPAMATRRTAGTAEDAIRDTRPVSFEGDEYRTQVYDRDRLPADSSFVGPAIVESDDSTAVIYPQQGVQVDEFGNLLVEVDP